MLATQIMAGLRETPIADAPAKYVELYEACWQNDAESRPEIKEVLEKLKGLEEKMRKLKEWSILGKTIYHYGGA